MLRTCSLRRHIVRLGSTTATHFLTRAGSRLVQHYKHLVATEGLSYDEKQFRVVRLLEKLRNLVEDPTTSPASFVAKIRDFEAAQVKKETATSDKEREEAKVKILPPKRLKGIYLHGAVGTGKTMLMDLFYTHCDVSGSCKKRVHFNDFMLDVHQRIHRHKQALLEKHGRSKHVILSEEHDSLRQVAETIATEACVFCFDEFQVTDVADAMILSKLFHILWKRGVVLVATSNRPPQDLYLNGLNRQYFLPFIEELQRSCVVQDIGILQDYRKLNIAHEGAYFVPHNNRNARKLREQFDRELSAHPVIEFEQHKRIEAKECSIDVMMGRHMTLTKAAPEIGTCWVEFSEMCRTEKGAADYLALCDNFHTIFMPDIPVLSVLSHNEARRFITLVDVMYNANVRFVWSAAAEPFALFKTLTAAEAEEAKFQLGTSNFGTDHAWQGEDFAVEDKNIERLDQMLPEVEPHPLRDERDLNSVRRGISDSCVHPTVPLHELQGRDEWERHHERSSTQNLVPAVDAVDAAQDDLKVLEGELASVQELNFAFKRAASRLTEMSSREYFSRWRDKFAVHS